MILKIVYALILSSAINNIAHADNLMLSEVINSFSVSPIQIVYSNDYLQADQISVNKKISSINDLYNYLHRLGYQLKQVNEHTYLIKPRQADTKNSNQRMLYWQIKAMDSGQRITSAKVTLESGSRQMSNNSLRSGFVFLQYPADTYQITAEAEGYISKTLTLDLSVNAIRQQNINLQKQPKKLGNLYVTASLYDFSQYGVANQNIITADELNDNPHLGNDPIRSASKLPGLVSNGISARPHARGGKQNESQVMLNGLTLRNPYHFKDFFSIFSTINLTYVEDVSVYAGVFPVKHGGYISSVMDIQSIEPSDALFANASLGLLNSHMTVAQKINEQSSYLASYRSGGDFFKSKLIEFETGDPSFDDLFLQFNHRFDNGFSISAQALNSRDKINLFLQEEDEKTKARYADNNYWITVDKRLNDVWDTRHTLFTQTSTTDRFGELTDNEIQGSIFEKSRSSFQGLHSTLTYQASQKMTLNFGALFQHEKTKIDYRKHTSGSDFIDLLLNPNLSSRSRIHSFNNKGKRQAYHANVRYQFTKKFFADMGLRYDTQDWIHKKQKSPRLNLSYFYDDSLTFRIGSGRHYQEQSIDSVLLEDDELGYFEPEAADISVFEVQKRLSKTYALRGELYYKKYHNVQPYYENLLIGLHLQPELFTDRIRVEPEGAFSKGIDLTFDARHENINWSLGYSFSEVKDVIDSQEVYRSWDQQNALKLGFDWFGEKWQVHSIFKYHTGWPITEVTFDNSQINIGQRNAVRHKDFLNLDLKISYDFSFKGKKLRYWFQLANATNQDNPCCSEYTFEENDLGVLSLTKQQKYWMPIIPSMGIDINF